MIDDATPGEPTGAGAAVPPVVSDPETVLPSDQLGDLGALSTARLRELRAVCEDAEEGVSYARRLLQGRLDLLRAELERRGDGGSAELLDALPTILAADERSTDQLHARSTRVRVPESAHGHTDLMDQVVSESLLSRIDTAELEEIERVVIAAGDHEQMLSSLRRAWFDRIDALRDELAARYKDGRADVADLLH